MNELVNKNDLATKLRNNIGQNFDNKQTEATRKIKNKEELNKNKSISDELIIKNEGNIKQLSKLESSDNSKKFKKNLINENNSLNEYNLNKNSIDNEYIDKKDKIKPMQFIQKSKKEERENTTFYLKKSTVKNIEKFSKIAAMKPKEFVEEVLTQYFEMFKDEVK